MFQPTYYDIILQYDRRAINFCWQANANKERDEDVYERQHFTTCTDTQKPCILYGSRLF